MKRTIAALLATVALVAGCGDDDSDAADTTSSTTETTAGSTSTSVEPQEPATDAGDAPERIVSLGPTGTEILYAIGAAEQVVAVDDQSNYPDGVPTTDLSSYEPNVEAVVAYDPDLVLITGTVPDEAVTGLEAVGVDVLYLEPPTVIDEVYEQFMDIGIASGHEDEAADLVEEVRGAIDELVARVPERDEPPTYFHEVDATLYTATSSTFIGQIYALAGLENIADPADPDGSLGGYPQLSAEFLVNADPDYVFLSDANFGETPEAFAARPGFGSMTAVQEGNVIPLDADIVSRWGPRIVDFLRVVIEATTT